MIEWNDGRDRHRADMRSGLLVYECWDTDKREWYQRTSGAAHALYQRLVKVELVRQLKRDLEDTLQVTP